MSGGAIQHPGGGAVAGRRLAEAHEPIEPGKGVNLMAALRRIG